MGRRVDVQGDWAAHPSQRLGRRYRAAQRQGRHLGQGPLLQGGRRLHAHPVLHRSRRRVLQEGRDVRQVHDGLRPFHAWLRRLGVRGVGLPQLRSRAQDVAVALLLLRDQALRREELLRALAHEQDLRAGPRLCRHLRLRRLDGPLERARGGRRPGHHADPRQHQGGHFEGRDGSEHEALHEGLGPRHRGRAVQDARLDREDGPGRGVVAVEVGRPPRAPHEQRRARRQTLRRELQRLAGLGLLPDDVRLRRDLLEGRHDSVLGARGPLRQGAPVGGLGRGLLHDQVYGPDRRGPAGDVQRRGRQRVRGPGPGRHRRLQRGRQSGLPPLQGHHGMERVLQQRRRVPPGDTCSSTS
mmetsp:Transcript_47691/g.136401  ORF Transcript_47691/g.136401 Transcript_47691/m.136401 type:complete len:355 (+) Transcript_47691:1274-2338(+)